MMMTQRFTILALILLSSSTVVGDELPVRGPGGLRPGIGGANRAGEKEPVAWNKSEIVFVGKLESVVAGPVGRSLPPLYTHQLHFTVQSVLRGDVKPGAKIVASHTARQHQRPTFPEGEICIAAASKARGSMRLAAVQQATEQKTKEVQLLCALPLGWKVVDEEPVSPWAAFSEYNWPKNAEFKNGVELNNKRVLCGETGRPALLVGPGIEFVVEKVEPPKSIKWTNPDGDGEYKITVTNTTDEPLEVAALLAEGDNIMWNESLVILCQGKSYVYPDGKEIPESVRPLSLEANESVSTVIHVLRLNGPQWPRGGNRVEFQFCLGEKSRTESFYYMSRHHDAIREGLSGEQ